MKTQSINVKDACNRTKRKTQFSVDTENMVNEIQPVFMKKIKNHWKKKSLEMEETFLSL